VELPPLVLLRLVQLFLLLTLAVMAAMVPDMAVEAAAAVHLLTDKQAALAAMAATAVVW
jgi:hypothetical protein